MTPDRTISRQPPRRSAAKRDLLARELERRRRAASHTQAIPRRPDRGPAPLSFAQQRLWFLDEFAPQNPSYNIARALHLCGPLQVTALRRSFETIARRHETLRTTFAVLDGQPAQIVSDAVRLSMPTVDLVGLPQAARKAETRRLAQTEARRPFDLARGPFLRLTLLRLGATEHVLLLTMHHVVFDEWSMGLLWKELAATYEALSRDGDGARSAGAALPMADLSVQYADWAIWQRGWLQGEVLETQLAYWKRQLDGDLPPLALPTDRPRPPVQTYRGALHTFHLPRPLSEALKALSRQEGGTLFMALLAAFKTLLHRYTGQTDVVVGSPVAGRNRTEVEGLIGLFVNTLALRTDLSGNPTFRALLSRVRRVALGAFSHQDLPFEKLLEELQPERDLSRHPLYQVLFVFQNTPASVPALPGLSSTLTELHHATAKFDLTLFVEETGEGLRGRLEYNTDLFDAATITRLAGHFQTLLEGLVADPDAPISQLNLLTEAERQQLLVEWNDTARDYPRHQCLHELFEAQVARTPDALAVAFPIPGANQHLTFRELNRRAEQLAGRLQALGVGPETLVGICVERSLEMVVGLLAVLKAGGAYVPLDPTYPRERLAFMLADTAAPIILTQSHLQDRLPRSLIPNSQYPISICLDTLDSSETKDILAPSGVTADNLAYVIYTSGSTGRPKGVALTHRNAAALLTWAATVYTPADLAGVLAATSISFDLSIFELFVTLCDGGQIILAENALDLPHLPAPEQVTLLNTVPSALDQLVQNGGLPPLRVVNLAGEVLQRALAQQICQSQTVGRLLNLYGPTEDTTYSTGTLVARDAAGPPPIGRPIPNTQVYLLDDALQPVPVGVPGEIYLGGDGLARGYLHAPGLTAERFIPDPFPPPSSPPGGETEGGASTRLYKTGDLARYLPDGNLEFLGRLDHQVKVRGYRVEPGEIEAVLAGHPALRQVVVAALAAQEGGQRLVAYLVAREGQAVSVGELRRFVQTQLPDYMVPSAFVTLDALPRTPNGKVDRRALPAPQADRPALEAAFVAPRTPGEELLADVWTQLLAVERVGVRDDFFELGGHSLLATQVVSRVRDLFGVELPLRALFEAPTVAALAARVAEARRTGQALQLPPITPLARDAAAKLPLSFAQQRLWFLDRWEPESPFYNLPFALRLTGRLDVGALAQSLHGVLQRHEALRTTFPAVDGQPAQVVVPARPLDLPVVDLEALPPDEREAQTRRLTVAGAQLPFDLARGPLLRATLFRLSDACPEQGQRAEHVLFLCMHHIVSDGWSLGILTRELAALYRAACSGDPGDPLPELPIQYVDFAAWQRRWLRGAALESQLAYWKEQLGSDLPVLELPTDRPRPAVQSLRGATHTFLLPPSLSDALKALSRRAGVTLFMTLLAAFELLLHRYTGQTDIAVGSPIANRNRGEIEGLVGFFVNTLVLRADLSGDPTFRELLARVREMALGAYAHQDLPFEMLVDELQPERDLSHTPLFQVMFALQNAPAETLDLPELNVSPYPIEIKTSVFDLTLYVRDAERGLQGTVEYNVDLFDPSTIARLARHLQTLLQGVAANPDLRLADVTLLTEAERRQLLFEWNDTAADYPRGRCLHELLAVQAGRTPDAIAVVCDADHLSYGALQRRAGRLAGYLRARGVGPETFVGVCVERSLELAVGLWGVLQAGGAYLPLDPTYPPERLSLMLTETQSPLLLTQAHLAPPIPTVCLDRDWKTITAQHAPPAAQVVPENLAYAIYTSGSTGRPKGVLVSHRALVNHSLAVAGRYDLGPGDRVLQFASISFDVAAEELFPSWLRGATVALSPNPSSTPLGEWLAWVETAGLTVMNLPAAYWHAWMAERPRVPDALRLVVVGSEKVSPQRLADWQEVVQGRVAWLNAYGPTEATITATTYEPDGADRDRPSVPIGCPINNAQTYVLDGRLNPAPVGVPGELYIGGDGLARGYLDRPGLTAAQFVPDPFAPSPNPPPWGGIKGGARLYRTGDLARWLPDGNLEFLGRADQQVKVRGFRVELGEIEAVLGAHPALREAAVVASPTAPDGGQRLVAYVVAGEREAPPVDELRRFLQIRLPAYMLPSAFVTLAALPLTPGGKLDRRALPPFETAPEAGGASIAPRTPVERALAEIWTQVIGVEQVGVHDNFFDLGGDSILSIQIVARANQAGLHLTPKQLFERQTVAELAAVAGTGPATRAEQGPLTGPLPLTPVQRWFFEQDLPDPQHYNQALLLKARRALEPALLERAWQALLAHHDALRLRFERTGSGWRQVNAAPGEDVPLTLFDLSALPAVDQKPTVEKIAAALQASLDLADGPLLRVALFDLGGGEPDRLLLLIHHLAVDGVSWRILLDDLSAAYRRLARGEPVHLPLKTTAFKRWAERLAEHAQSGALRRELDDWLARPWQRVAPLPLDDPSGANRLASARTVSASLNEQETSTLLRDVPQAYGTQINAVLLAALAQTFAGWTGTRLTLLDLEGHGREAIFENVDLSRTVGWFTAIFPVLLDLKDVQGPEQVRSVQAQLDRIPHKGVNYGVLRYLSADPEIAGKLDALPQPQVSFNYLGQFDQTLAQSALFERAPESQGPLQSPRGARRHLLEIDGRVNAGQLELIWTYSQDLHRRATIERLAREFIRALRAMMAHGQSGEAGGSSPPGLTEFEWSEHDLEDILQEIGRSVG